MLEGIQVNIPQLTGVIGKASFSYQISLSLSSSVPTLLSITSDIQHYAAALLDGIQLNTPQPHTVLVWQEFSYIPQSSCFVLTLYISELSCTDLCFYYSNILTKPKKVTPSPCYLLPPPSYFLSIFCSVVAYFASLASVWTCSIVRFVFSSSVQLLLPLFEAVALLALFCQKDRSSCKLPQPLSVLWLSCSASLLKRERKKKLKKVNLFSICCCSCH